MTRLARHATSAAVVLLFGSLAIGQSVRADITTIQLPDEHFVSEAALEDVDGDGRTDLLVVRSTFKKPRRRTLAIHLRGDGPVPFKVRETAAFPLTPDVAALAIADFSTAKDNEILLFNRSGVFARKLATNGTSRPRKILTADFLWQFPHDDETIMWNRGVRDIDGDGLQDLLVAEPGGYLLAFQDRAEDGRVSFARTRKLRVPLELATLDAEPLGAFALRARKSSKSVELRIRSGGRPKDDPRLPLLEVVESVPAPQLADWDGDKDLDLIIRSVDRLYVWLQEPGGKFVEAPDRSYENPVVADRSRRLDVSYSAHISDLNGDGRADCLMVAGNKRSEKVRSQVLVFVNGAKGPGASATTEAEPLFGPRGIPQQLLPLAGFAAVPGLEDVNGDGRPDFSVATFRPDLIDAMRKNIELGYHVFLNRNGTFSSRADLNGRLVIRSSKLQRAQAYLSARFFADVTGDGLKDLLIQDSRTTVSIRAPRRRPSGFDLQDKPIWSLNWDGYGILRAPRMQKGDPELMVLQRGSVLHVRFPR